jgi:hypothetical protein
MATVIIIVIIAIAAMMTMAIPPPASPVPAIPIPAFFLAIPIALALRVDLGQIRQTRSYDEGHSQSYCKCVLFQFLCVHFGTAPDTSGCTIAAELQAPFEKRIEHFPGQRIGRQ